MGDRKKQAKERTSSRIPLEPEIVVQEGETTNETGDTGPETTTCSNEQIVNLQKTIENGFTSMASSMGSMFQQAFSSWEDNMLRDDQIESENDEEQQQPKGRESEMTI